MYSLIYFVVVCNSYIINSIGEVLNKLPVMQHVVFGKLFQWNGPPKSSTENNSNSADGKNVPMSGVHMGNMNNIACVAPWAKPTGASHINDINKLWGTTPTTTGTTNTTAINVPTAPPKSVNPTTTHNNPTPVIAASEPPILIPPSLLKDW